MGTRVPEIEPGKDLKVHPMKNEILLIWVISRSGHLLDPLVPADRRGVKQAVSKDPAGAPEKPLGPSYGRFSETSIEKPGFPDRFAAPAGPARGIYYDEYDDYSHVGREAAP